MRTRLLGLSALVAVLAASLLAAGAVNVGSAAAQDATAAPTLSPTASTNQVSYVRVIHAIPDGPAFDLYLNGEKAIGALKFGESTDFVELPIGNYSIDIRPIGAAKTDKPLYSATIGLPAGVSVNIMALGLFSGKDAQAFKLTVFLTDRSPTNGKARVEMFHAAPDGPAIDVLTGGSAIVTQLPFGKNTDKALNLDPKAYDLTIVASGTTSPALINLKAFKLQADTIYTILAVGQASNQSIKPLIISTISLEMLQKLKASGALTPKATQPVTTGIKPATARPTVAVTPPR